MKTLHLYLLRQVAATLVVTVGVFTFVLLLGNVLKDVLDLLASPKATAGVLLQALALLVPFVLSFSLPIGMLTATLLTFGRFSADQELTAVRAAGISLVSAVMPVVALSLALCGICAWFNCDLGPRARVAFKELRDTVVRDTSNLSLGEGRYIELGSVTLYARRIEGDQMRDVRVGQPVKITVDALGGRVLTGKVERISPATGSEFSVIRPDNATGNFTKVAQRIPVRIRIDPGQEAAQRLAPGMSVVAKVDTAG